MITCAVFLCACGGSSDKSTSSANKKTPQNESREMPASTLKLKGSHASLFKVEKPYLLRLVQTPDNGWEVRIKATLAKVREIDTNRYQKKIDCCPDMAYMNEFDVEVQKGQLSCDYFDTLCDKAVGEPEELILKPFLWNPISYETAKKIYDAITYVIITDMELAELEPEDILKSGYQSPFDDDDIRDLKDAAETASKILEAEKNLLDALY